MSQESMQPQFYPVVATRRESHDTVTLEIEADLSLAPGQFNMLYAFGIGEVPISMGGHSREGHLVHTIRAVGKVTEALCRLKPGDSVGLRGPFGTSWPMERLEGRQAVIVAGGLGIVPLKAVIERLADSKHPSSLFYGARSPADLIYQDALPRWSEAFAEQVYTTVDFDDSSWTGNVGVVTQLIRHGNTPLDGAVAFVCGPEIMMRFTVRDLLHRGVASEDIYLSMERNMKCAIGHCGHCQYVGDFICKDGPVFAYDHLRPFFGRKEL